MHVFKGLLRCKSVCDVKPELDPCPLLARPGEIFGRAHFHLIAEGQTSPRAEGDVEIVQEVRSLLMVKEFSNDTSLLNISQANVKL